MNLTTSMLNFVRKNSSALLTGMSIVGLLSTLGLSISATKKAVKIIDDDLEPKERIKKIAPIYIPTALSAVATTSAILGIHFTNAKTQASLISAYTILNNSYKEYKDKVHAINGDYKIETEIVKDCMNDTTPSKSLDDECVFFDYFSLRYFTSTIEKVKKAEDLLNEKYFECGLVCVNDFYDLLGIPRLECGYELGWNNLDTMSFDEYSVIDFIHEEVALKDGSKCYAIIMPFEPEVGYNR